MRAPEGFARRGTRALLIAALAGLALLPTSPPARADAPQAATAKEPAESARARFVGDTPEAIIAAETARATAKKATEADQVSALAVIADVAGSATEGAAERALSTIAHAPGVGAEVRGDAAALARALSHEEGTKAGVAKARALGILTDVAILGPFRDTGGGLDAHEGPEAKGAHFQDPRAMYSWGSVEVGWRAVPQSFAQARGVPLDLFVHPRKESCTFVASKIRVDKTEPIVVRLAAAGQARLMVDGVDVARSDDVHAEALFDRLAAKVEAKAGPHVVAAKICTGALPDSGRVRLRVTDASHAPLDVHASSDLAPKPGEAIAWGDARALAPKKLSTPVARTIAAKGTPQGGTTTARLDAAIARTLGGADDLKSPRAPGELDALMHASDLSADEVAMAAWISSSGANRSARLYRAKALAEKSGDQPAARFVERRLVEQHLDGGMADWALATLRGAKLDAMTDGEAEVLEARALLSLRVDALTIEAQRSLARAFRAAPTTAPDALLLTLLPLSRYHDTKTWLAAADELARRGIRGEVLVDASSARGEQAVVAAAEDAFVGGMEDADEALMVAQQVTDAGAEEVAAKLWTTLVRWAPNRAEAWAGAARALSASPRSEADAKKVVMALARARQLAPGDAKYRAELALRTQAAKTKAEEEHGDERYLTPIATILARRKGVRPASEGPPKVADRELHWLRVVKMHADNRVSQLIQYAREIVVPPRTEQELFEPIPPEGDLTEILRARVHRKDGGIAFPTEVHNDGRRPRIRWPELEAGDTVEVLIRQWTSTAVGGRGDAPFYFMDYAGAPETHPLLYNEVVVETLPGHPLHVDVIHDGLVPYTRTEKDERGVHVLRLVWDKPMSIPEEPLSPQVSEIAPVIVGSTFANWNDFRAWYQGAVRGFTEPDAEVKRLAKELTKGKRTKEDKVRALFEFVADDIRYVNYVSGEWWLPNRPQQLLARREGDCDDKAILLITLLRAVGIEAEEVMVQTRLTGQPSVVLAKKAAVPMFDHGIAFLPGPNGGRYLDATSPQSRLGPIPSMDARAVALRMDGTSEIVHLPASSPDDHGAEVTWTLTLAPDGSATLKGEELHTGDGAFWLRSNLSQPEARAQYVEDALVGPWLATVEIDKDVDFKGDLPKGQARVRYEAKSRGLARHEGKDLVLSLSPSNTYGSRLAPLPRRTLPVQLPSYLAPSHHHRKVRVVAPKGFAWGPLPPGGVADGGDFGTAHISITRDPKDARALVIDRSVVFDEDLIPVSRYAAWRAWIQKVDALMHKDVRLVAK